MVFGLSDDEIRERKTSAARAPQHRLKNWVQMNENEKKTDKVTYRPFGSFQSQKPCLT